MNKDMREFYAFSEWGTHLYVTTKVNIKYGLTLSVKKNCTIK